MTVQRRRTELTADHWAILRLIKVATLDFAKMHPKRLNEYCRAVAYLVTQYEEGVLLDAADRINMEYGE